MTAWYVIACAVVLLGGFALYRGQALSLFLKVLGVSMRFETKHRTRP